MHPWLAFLCFFRLLFGRKLPVEAAEFLPEEAKQKLLPEVTEKVVEKQVVVEKVVAKPAEKPKVSVAQHHRDGALALLAPLQREGRFVDFVRDSGDGASHADI